jgi:hypothetical protein
MMACWRSSDFSATDATCQREVRKFLLCLTQQSKVRAADSTGGRGGERGCGLSHAAGIGGEAAHAWRIPAGRVPGAVGLAPHL